ncbi:MAG: type II secretion system F family protein [Phycisphaerae bacterium]|nr:type II secretion system F family protein [Phycisphaerae bacterium]
MIRDMGDIGLLLAACLVPLAMLIAVDHGLAWLVWYASGLRGARPRSLIVSLIQPLRYVSFAAVAVTHLSTAARMNVPLHAAMAAAAMEERGRLRGIMRRLADALAAGRPVGAALDASVPACPGLVVSLVRAGERTGQLAPALSAAEGLLTDVLRHGRIALLGPVSYIIWVLTGLGFTLTLFGVTVMPRFRDIFLDFAVPLPRMTDWVMTVMSLPAAFALGFMPVVLVVVIILVLLAVRPRRPERPRALSVLHDRIRWRCPVLRDLERSFGYATCLNVISAAARGGLSMDVAAQVAAEVDVNINIRRQFESFADRIMRGDAPPEAAKHAGLGTVIVGALGAARRGTPIEQALRFAREYHMASARRWWHVLMQLMIPALTLAAAAVVGLVIVSLFLPLAALINGVLESVGG